MRAGLGVLFNYLFVCCPGAPWLHDRELEVDDGVPCRSERADGIKVATENVFPPCYILCSMQILDVNSEM